MFGRLFETSSMWNYGVLYFYKAKRILERRGIQTSSLFVKIWLVCISEFKANFFFSFIWLGFLARIYWSSLDHDLMTSIWKKGISILAGNLNSGRSYLITAVIGKQIVIRPKHINYSVITHDFNFPTQSPDSVQSTSRWIFEEIRPCRVVQADFHDWFELVSFPIIAVAHHIY